MTTPAATHEVQSLVDDLHARYLSIDEGEVATYIPELAKADPGKFGVSVVTADGRIFEAGDCEQPFTIQSISKPFTFGMALEELGHDEVCGHVGVEPSGDAFNSIELQNGTNRPFNPMINTGAITVTALLHARYGDETFDHLLDRFSTLAGRPLSIDEAVYAVGAAHRPSQPRHRPSAAELRHGPRRSRSGARRLLQAVLDPGDLPRSRDDGRHAGQHGPQPDRPAQSRSTSRCVKDMLSIMFTCGMYDYSGQWAYRVGVPAKSGVGGGVIAVVNRQLGIATYSPRLDRTATAGGVSRSASSWPRASACTCSTA